MLESLKYCDGISHERQVVCAPNAGRARADHRDFLIRLAELALSQLGEMPGAVTAFIVGFFQKVVVCVWIGGFGSVLLGEESFEGPDRNWFIDRSAAAGIFTRGRTDPPAHGSERVGGARYEERLLVSLL
jgi:hypothetical protein